MGLYLNKRNITYQLCIGVNMYLHVGYGVNDIDDAIAERYPALFEKIETEVKQEVVEETKETVKEAAIEEDVCLDIDEKEEALELAVIEFIEPEKINIETVLTECQGKTKKEIDNIASKYGISLDKRKNAKSMLESFESELTEMNE